MKLKLSTILFIYLSFLYSYTISGFIKDGSNGEPLSYTNIILLDQNKGAASDINGYFIIPDVDKDLIPDQNDLRWQQQKGNEI